ncbi:MAG: Gfo/Idh/MocA family oxidoreductase [Thermoguttaceae bacterium]|nr:Gfo/Idh/MocA family oxidoreductase [Thermoguttaceae bacterium]
MPDRSSAVSRRRFLAAAAQAGAVLAVPLFVPGRALGKDGAVSPSERIVLGGLGIGGRGQHVLGCMMDEPVVQFVAIADARRMRREQIKNLADTKYGNKDCATYRDFREMLARPDIDAVLIATGDRWHTLASIYAAKAGKDIYCEKPCSMTIAESRALADTVNRYGRIYQAGTQRRSIANFIFAADLVHSGKLGKLKTVHANTLAPGVRHDWLPAEPEPPKDEVDWDLWLGPCPWRPFNKQYVAGGWRGFFDFHGGGILEWGAHTVDLCQWAAQADHTTPVEYEPTPNGCIATYANGVKLVMRDTGWMGLGTCSARYEGEDGWVETGDTGRVELSAGARAEQRVFTEVGTSPVSHVKNFLECVKTRTPANANADVAARSHIVCHAAYIAWQLGRTLKFDPVKEEFIGDAEANRMRSRALREPWRI